MSSLGRCILAPSVFTSDVDGHGNVPAVAVAPEPVLPGAQLGDDLTLEAEGVVALLVVGRFFAPLLCKSKLTRPAVCGRP